MLASPLRIPTMPVKLRYPPPELGENSQEILRTELGYSKKKIAKLKDDKVI